MLENVPVEFKCPIRMEVMTEPMTAPDGYTYEKDSLAAHLLVHPNSPLTRQPMTLAQCYPNRALKGLIETWQQQRNGNPHRFFVNPRMPQETHKDVMKKLKESLNIPFSEVYTGTVVEQSFVGMAGIYTSQQNSIFRRNMDGTTYFQLSFANGEELNKFLNYYRQQFHGLILKNEKVGETIYKITVDTLKLHRQLTPRLGTFHQKSHDQLMNKFQAELNTTQNEVLWGTVVEENLVKSAGINRNQDGAIFRRGNNYATYFNLRLQPQEQQTFCQFYQNKYPGIILAQSRQPSSEWVKITMNTKLLQSDVARDLGEQVVANNPGRRPRV